MAPPYGLHLPATDRGRASPKRSTPLLGGTAAQVYLSRTTALRLEIGTHPLKVVTAKAAAVISAERHPTMGDQGVASKARGAQLRAGLLPRVAKDQRSHPNVAGRLVPWTLAGTMEFSCALRRRQGSSASLRRRANSAHLASRSSRTFSSFLLEIRSPCRRVSPPPRKKGVEAAPGHSPSGGWLSVPGSRNWVRVAPGTRSFSACRRR
jgi:hypothetical protein